ncbi:ABC transporter permease [Pseudoalteromonas luteoviolacea]|uniref:MacB-like periplasmic core domain-containing protein n=1 Tax=Pseudoalteromonas luteoviolacea NCIMB 1942 TaxID=1365253 RepID=A0A167D0B4_9GAMM|nr:ABC transporter permease [Pseudoalteromonas luteoviolacea]KZN48268.1 hypothetical protein N482_08345 [Pseudoalteromonas luteoviolacea NCIMB 1942]
MVRSSAQNSYHFGFIEAYKAQHQGIETMALHNINIDVEQSLPNSPTFNMGAITPEFMQIIDVPLALGHHINEHEGMNSNQPIAVISYDIWPKYFNGSPMYSTNQLLLKG